MTFLEGLLSFISPCILPMVPVCFICYAGESGGARRLGATPPRPKNSPENGFDIQTSTFNPSVIQSFNHSAK